MWGEEDVYEYLCSALRVFLFLQIQIAKFEKISFKQACIYVYKYAPYPPPLQLTF